MADTTLISPTDGATGVDTSPELEWESVAGANSYQVQVATSEALLTTTPDVLDEVITPSRGPLIYTSKSPGFGKIKPKQWGPLSAVRTSVYRNAEKIGIDASDLLVHLPIWESAGNGLINLGVGGGDLLLTGGTGIAWSQKGVKLGASSYFETARNIDAINPPFSFVAKFYQAKDYSDYSSSNAYALMASHTDGSDGWWSWQSSFYDSGIRFASNHGNYQAGTPQIGWNTVVFVLESADVSKVYLNGDLVGTGDNGWVTGDTAPFRLESNNSETSVDSYLTWNYAYYVKSLLTQEQISMQYDTPYALLQRQPKTIYSFAAPATTKALSGLSSGTTHYWRVRADV